MKKMLIYNGNDNIYSKNYFNNWSSLKVEWVY